MATRAVRNNNPGNLWTGGKIIFPGQSGVDSGGFAVFSSYNAGVAAADQNLQHYANLGWNTPASIATHWSTTDQTAYTNNMASALGVNPNTPLNLSDPNVRNSVLQDIFHQEDSNYKANTSNIGSSIWNSINNAVNNGGPITGLASIPGAVMSAVHGVLATAGDAANVVIAPGNPVGGVGLSSLNDWLSGQASEAAKKYGIPIAVAIGAILLIWVSGWNLVKDTPIGQTAKTASKAAMAGAFV